MLSIIERGAIMKEMCVKCPWYIEDECVLGYFNCMKELEEEYKEEMKETED